MRIIVTWPFLQQSTRRSTITTKRTSMKGYTDSRTRKEKEIFMRSRMIISQRSHSEERESLEICLSMNCCMKMQGEELISKIMKGLNQILNLLRTKARMPTFKSLLLRSSWRTSRLLLFPWIFKKNKSWKKRTSMLFWKLWDILSITLIKLLL